MIGLRINYNWSILIYEWYGSFDVLQWVWWKMELFTFFTLMWLGDENRAGETFFSEKKDGEKGRRRFRRDLSFVRVIILSIRVRSDSTYYVQWHWRPRLLIPPGRHRFQRPDSICKMYGPRDHYKLKMRATYNQNG